MKPSVPPISRVLRLACAGVPLLMLVTPAGAAPAWKDWKPGAPCFARSYDAEHLAAHPKQRLTQFALGASSLDAVVPNDSFEVTFRFRLKGDSAVYQTQAICRGGARTVNCGIEGDGGQFTMRADGPSLLLTIASMEVEGENDFSPDLAMGGDDRVVRLFAGPKSACRFD